MSNETPKARSMRRQVIALLAAAALLIIGLSLTIAYRHDEFTRTADLYFITDNANSLAPGTGVRLSGIRIGAVSDVTMQPDLSVRVTLTISADTLASLRTDARALLVREQLRAPALDLFAGKATQPLPADKRQIAYHRGATLTEMADELRQRITPILDDVKQFSGMLRGRQDDMRLIIENTRDASQHLASAANQMHALASDARGRVATMGVQAQSSLAELNKSLARASALLGQAETGLGAVTTALPGLVQKTERTLDQLQGVVNDGRTVSTAAAAQLPGLMRGAVPLLDDANEMVQGAKQAWPIRSLLPAAPPALLPIDSHDAKVLREPPAR